MFLETFVCKERRGTHYRTVIEVEPTIEVEMYLRRKLQPPLATPIKDVSRIHTPGTRLFMVGDVGVILKGTLEVDGMPDVHVGFWDKVLAGREQMCYHVGEEIVRGAGSKGVWTAIPKTSRPTLAFAKRVGFKVFHETADTVALDLLFT